MSEASGVRITVEERVPKLCLECDAPAQFKVTYLLSGARSNPASNAYGKDDCSWCEDEAVFVCQKHLRLHEQAPDGYGFCSRFENGERFKHLFHEWVPVTNTARARQLVAEAADSEE